MRSPLTNLSRACRFWPLALLACSPCQGQVWLGLGAGTRGAELTLGDRFAPLWGVEADVATFSLSRDNLRVADNRYDASARLLSGRALLDWHPLGNGWCLSAGIVLDDNRATGHTVPAADGTVTIGSLKFPTSIVGALAAKLDYSPIAPAVNFGWISSDRPGLGGYAHLGAFYQGRPRVSLTAEIPAGSPLNDPLARSALNFELAHEAGLVEARVDRYRVYPMLDFGLAYRF